MSAQSALPALSVGFALPKACRVAPELAIIGNCLEGSDGINTLLINDGDSWQLRSRLLIYLRGAIRIK